MSRELPWHQLGTKLNFPASAHEAIQAADLGWKVIKNKEAVYSEQRLRPGYEWLFREDIWNKNGGGLLGSVRSDYEPIQNAAAFSFLDQFVETGIASFDSAGMVGIGEFVWIVLHFCGELEIAAGDSIKKFLFFGNSLATGYHRLAYMPVRSISGCILNGGFFHNPEPIISTPNDRPRRFIEPMSKVVETIRHRFDVIGEQFRAMTKRLMSDEDFNQFLTKVFDDYTHKSKWHHGGAAFLHLSLEDRKQCAGLFRTSKENAPQPSNGTLWMALNAAAEYVDFHMPIPAGLSRLETLGFSELKGSALKVAKTMVR